MSDWLFEGVCVGAAVRSSRAVIANAGNCAAAALEIPTVSPGS